MDSSSSIKMTIPRSELLNVHQPRVYGLSPQNLALDSQGTAPLANSAVSSFGLRHIVRLNTRHPPTHKAWRIAKAGYRGFPCGLASQSNHLDKKNTMEKYTNKTSHQYINPAWSTRELKSGRNQGRRPADESLLNPSEVMLH